MKEFKDKVAVITGSASGIGYAIAERSVREGMKVVLADIEEDVLFKTADRLKADGGTVIAVTTDVSKESAIKNLARITLDTFGAVHLLFNNAGVGNRTTIWESFTSDWEWILGVNLWGVIHGVRIFVPIMINQNTECHIINTASSQGLISPPEYGIYNVSKHGVVSLSETLYKELLQRGANVKVSVLCPGWVKTKILNAARNRPSEYLVDFELKTLTMEEEKAQWDAIESVFQSGHTKQQCGVVSPEYVANCVFEGIRNERFYIITHPETKESVRKRMENILNEQNPAV